MSEENVEIATRWYEPATSKDELLAAMPRTMALCHPEVEWSAPEDGTIYRGREESAAARGMAAKLSLATDMTSSGSSTAEAMRCWSRPTRRLRGVISGAEVRSTNYELLTIRDGMIVRIREFYDEGDALEAAGLRE